jgi:ADP-heptose:LPS heptosyltransferase
MKALFVTSTRIGDAVLSTGILAHILRARPDMRVTIACGPASAPLFEAVPGLERLIVVEKRPYAAHWLDLWAKCALPLWHLVVDLRGSALAYFLRARYRRVLRPALHRGHQIQRLARAFGLPEPPAPTIWTAPRHEETAARLIPGGAPVLALGPTANWAPKIWPAENFVALAARLTGPGGILSGARVAVLGGPGEHALAQPVIEALAPDRCIDLVGKIDLLTAAACLKRAALFVGNDSGLMHIAAATGIPTLGLFGPSSPALYAPWGPNAAVATTTIPYETLVGAPGFDHRATRCLMDSLTVDAAEQAARALMLRVAVPAQ